MSYFSMANEKRNFNKSGTYHEKDREAQAKGLSTTESLHKLHEAIWKELEAHEGELNANDRSPCRSDTWFADAYHHRSPYTTFSWPSALVLVISTILLLVCYVINKSDQRYDRIPVEVIIILLIVIGNIYLVGFDNRLRHHELLHKAKGLLHYLEKCIHSCKWKPNHYPQLNMPLSPCITLQWTYRDGELVNLHWALLVAGDVIALRPGQIVPATCYSMDDPSAPELKFGDMFVPPTYMPSEPFSAPQIRTPLSTKYYILLETPYVRSVRIALQQSRHRPISFFDKERHIILVHYLQKIVIPALLLAMVLANVLRSVYLDYVGDWTEMIFILQIEALLPLMPLMVPLCWILLNSYGMTRLIALFTLAKQSQRFEVFLDELGETPGYQPSMEISWNHVKEHLGKILLGQEEALCRTANLLHVFGSVTNLCCIDKKGILSWPNPTPEKVFFLKSGNCSGSGGILDTGTRDTSQDSLHGYDGIQDGMINECIPKDAAETEKSELLPFQAHQSGDNFFDHGYVQETCVEVLDLTHNNQVPFRVQFDDPKWKRHINSLKPLGVTILLNTCNPETQNYYTQFSSHIVCESLHNDVVVPVVSRRCLCELARQIGFTEQALDIFQLNQHLQTFRHVQPEQARRDKLARSLPNSKVKFPFPHMASVVIKETNTGMYQLLSQGTGDIILDSCSDFWDGQDVCPLSELDRKKILDFYHRTSLTSYCTAFSYRPLTTDISDNLSDVYLEIPAESGRLYSSLWSPTPPRSWEIPPLDSRVKVMSRCLSSDSLLGHALQDLEPISDAESCFEVQCNQVFIGMVAMQYQARTDMVHLIEQLDKACVRFIHFSKENELRSRVFSEKMGLESGWNCHISLLSPRARSESGNSTKTSKTSLPRKPPSTDDILGASEGPKSPKIRSTLESMRQLSYSAPSAINLDVTTVKFEDEISMHNVIVAEAASNTSEVNSRPPRGCGTISAFSTTDDEAQDDITDALIEQHGSQENCMHSSRSPSHITESTDQSVPITFDMSNRAKLPKGIENVRPHLENIDNVPLLVSLFTDCTANAIIEMIKIMQEYGEVVCCLGSSANCYNMPLFLQADASIAVEPLYPQLCVQQPVYESAPTDCPLPIEISHHLNSLSCSLSYYRDDPVSIYHLIMEARHFTMAMHNCFKFLLSCSLSLSFMIALSCILLLPPPISLSHTLVFVLFSLPLLSVSLIACPLDQQIMTLATAKNTHVVTKQAFFSFVGYTAAMFLPSILISLLCFGAMLYGLCNAIPDAECSLLFGNTNYSQPFAGRWNGWSDAYVYSFCVAQNLTAFILCLCYVCISASFVHRSHQLWKRNPFVNRLWCIAASVVVSDDMEDAKSHPQFLGKKTKQKKKKLVTLANLKRKIVEHSLVKTMLTPETGLRRLIFQIIYFAIDVHIRGNHNDDDPGIDKVPTEVWVISCVWPLFLLIINELVKKHKIKVDVRYQKRARLEFCTKLGMNSPF